MRFSGANSRMAPAARNADPEGSGVEASGVPWISNWRFGSPAADQPLPAALPAAVDVVPDDEPSPNQNTYEKGSWGVITSQYVVPEVRSIGVNESAVIAPGLSGALRSIPRVAMDIPGKPALFE
jgi:hypothetical protein